MLAHDGKKEVCLNYPRFLVKCFIQRSCLLDSVDPLLVVSSFKICLAQSKQRASLIEGFMCIYKERQSLLVMRFGMYPVLTCQEQFCKCQMFSCLFVAVIVLDKELQGLLVV